MSTRLARCTAFGTVVLWVLAACGGATEPTRVASVTVTPTTVTRIVGDTAQLTARTLDANGATLAGRAVTWSSSNTASATVSDSGVVTAVAPGPVTITATSEGKTGTAVVTVTLSPCDVSLATPITPGQTLSGTLASTDCNLIGDGSFYDIYSLEVPAATTIDVVLRSTDFDAYLYIFAGLTVNAAEDNNSGGGPKGTDARLSGSVTPGTYYILANSLNANGFGAYTLSLVSPFVPGSARALMPTLERVTDVRGKTLRALVRRP